MSLKLAEVNKWYGDLQALKSVTFDLKKGEIVGLLGPIGAGKTTLMKILTGALEQWEGDIIFQEKELKAHLQFVQSNTGYLAENNPLYLEKNVHEYLLFIASLYKIKHSDLEKTLRQVGLEDKKKAKIASLSKGYRQRVGLAAALLHNPSLLILDEPSTGLDPNQMIEIRALIRALGKDRMVLFSTHILSEVESVCDRVIIINKGEVVADQSMDSLRKNQSQIIAVEFDYRVETEALAKIEGVEKVVNTFDFKYEIHCNGSQDLRPKIFDFAHDNALKILMLQQKNIKLEQLFQSLTEA